MSQKVGYHMGKGVRVMKSGRKLRFPVYLVAFCVTVFLAFAMLILVSYMPQAPIDEHIGESAGFLKREGNYIAIADYTDSATLDNFTDAMILMESKALTKYSLSYTLLNPVYSYEPTEGKVEDLFHYAYDLEPTPSWYYTRYWMGFRAVVRPLLVIMNYMQIRQYLSYTSFFLLAVLIATISRNLNLRTAIAFAVSIILVKPHIICISLQFSCCFLIAFLAMLLVPWLNRHEAYEKLFFMEVGMLTMYFDFYTTPILTCGMPMIYLYLLRAKENRRTPVKSVLGNTAGWLAGYGLMWIAKMVLTTLLTSENAIASAFTSFFYNTGIKGAEKVNLLDLYLSVYRRIKTAVLSDSIAEVCFAIGMAAIAGMLLYRLYKGTLYLRDFAEHPTMLLIGLLPIAWFVVAARPLINHAYFQYRSIPVFFWAIGGYLCLLWKDKNNVLSTNYEKNPVFHEEN